MGVARIDWGSCGTDKAVLIAAAAAVKDRLSRTCKTACLTNSLFLSVLQESVHLISWVNSKNHAHMTMRGGCILPTEKPLGLKGIDCNNCDNILPAVWIKLIKTSVKLLE